MLQMYYKYFLSENSIFSIDSYQNQYPILFKITQFVWNMLTLYNLIFVFRKLKKKLNK